MSPTRRGPTPVEEIESFERRHRIRLPPSYREHLRTRGGGTPEPNCCIDEPRGVLLFVGLIFSLDDEIMAEQLFPFPPPRESGFLPVATNGGGNYFLVELTKGDIFYWDHERDDTVLQAADLLWLAADFQRLVSSLVYAPGERPEEIDEIERMGRSGSLDQLDELVARVGLDARNRAGRSVAEEAARHENLALVRRCLELGAPTRNLLHFAAPGENLSLIQYLVDHGADVNQLDDLGESPLDRAIEPEIYEFLERQGARHAKREKPPHLQ